MPDTNLRNGTRAARCQASSGVVSSVATAANEVIKLSSKSRDRQFHS